MSGHEDDYEHQLADLRDQRCRALGTYSPRCSKDGCSETDPLALTGAHPNILCREHLADQQGQSWTEDHHLSGEANSPLKVLIPANDHGVLSGLQGEWPRETLRNRGGSPLLRAAAAIRGWLDVLRMVIERTMRWIPAELESLDTRLSERHGPRWWEQLR